MKNGNQKVLLHFSDVYSVNILYKILLESFNERCIKVLGARFHLSRQCD